MLGQLILFLRIPLRGIRRCKFLNTKTIFGLLIVEVFFRIHRIVVKKNKNFFI